MFLGETPWLSYTCSCSRGLVRAEWSTLIARTFFFLFSSCKLEIYNWRIQCFFSYVGIQEGRILGSCVIKFCILLKNKSEKIIYYIYMILHHAYIYLLYYIWIHIIYISYLHHISYTGRIDSSIHRRLSGVLSRRSTGTAVGGPGFTVFSSRVGRFFGQAQKRSFVGMTWGKTYQHLLSSYE